MSYNPRLVNEGPSGGGYALMCVFDVCVCVRMVEMRKANVRQYLCGFPP
jgi:hypothetical protein